MEFRVLGPLQVLVDGVPVAVVAVGGAAERALPALLPLDAGRVVPADHLVESRRGEDPPAKAVQGCRGGCRGCEGVSGGRVAGRPGRGPAAGSPLDVDPQAVDVHRFARLVGQARRADGPSADRLYAAALGLWLGPALA
jgi:hypothetical protein